MRINRRTLLTSALAAGAVAGLAACGADEPDALASPDDGQYPAGTMTIFGYGQPQWTMVYYENWLERNRDIAPEVSFEMVQTEGEAQARQQLIQAMSAQDYDNAADVIQTSRVSMIDMAKNDVLVDMTEYLRSIEDQLVPGALGDSEYDGKLYGMPDSVRPQLLFYNREIFDEYGIDPESLTDFDAYLEAGRKLKTDSGGEVSLSHVDPNELAWRYWGRRGLVPQANGRIWDDEGNVVFGDDPGVRMAFDYLDTLHSEELLYVTRMFQAPLYDAIRAGRIASFYIGAFFDEFLRGNVADMSGQWGVVSAPVFPDVGTAGAPVIGMFAAVNKPDGQYAGLWRELWHDFQFDQEAREEWTNEMVANNAPYANPIATDLLESPFWQEPAEFYGGQSFRQAEAQGLENGSPNMRVTEDDAEADALISPELERYVAGAQTMDEAIANAQAALESRIGSTEPA